MGHEFSAEVLEAGPDTDAPAAGHAGHLASGAVVARPAFEPIVYSNNTTIGGYAERMLLSAPLLLPIPNGLDPRHAALTEPMAVGLHAVNKSAIQRGEDGAGARLRADRHCDHRRASPPRRGNHCGRRLFSTRRGPGDDDGRAPRPSTRPTGSPFDGASPAVVFEAVGVPGIINDVMRRAPVGARACRRRRVHAARHRASATSASPRRSTCSSCSPTTRSSSRSRLRAIAEGDIDVAPLITG